MQSRTRVAPGASDIFNDVYLGNDVSEERQLWVLCLFRLDFLNAQDMRAEIAGRPVLMGMAMGSNNLVRMKLQYLLMNLPLARRV
jgi:hypothetical protein